MPSFSERSLAKLRSCDERLIRVLMRAIKITDFTVLEGARGKEAQEAAFAAGTSHAHYPDSKHNKVPSQAVDIAPYPIDWSNRERFVYLAGIIAACAHEEGVALVWGGTFKKLQDLPHFELL